jgi:multidrug efflux pump subunit AcrA (membrane-fusion protein)
VSEVVPAVDPVARAFTVKVDLPAGEATRAMRPGMFARVRLRAGSASRLRVPVGAVVTEGASERVFVADAGRAHLRLVTTGAREDGRVHVSTGLDAGERVVVDPPRDLADGATLEVTP